MLSGGLLTLAGQGDKNAQVNYCSPQVDPSAWQFKLHTPILTSSMQRKYQATCVGMQEHVWLRGEWQRFNVTIFLKAIAFFLDSQSAEDPDRVSYKQSKLIAINYPLGLGACRSGRRERTAVLVHVWIGDQM